MSRGWDEKAWSSGGSGCAKYEPQPTFQGNIPALNAVCPSNRATADIAADADPASGLAVYDTQPDCSGSTACDWVQVGGTSLASPLVASMYALAGTPVEGTYPVTYPYQDTSQSADLFDITTGSDGTCGNVLCNAGTGWDGPTGLGTPDGVKALVGAPQGLITGQVTDAATGKPIAGVTVSASPGSYATRTDSNGDYTLNLATGTYALTTTDYGYQADTQSGVQVTPNQTKTENLALTAEPSGTLSGRVTDGSGHGWPLRAQITIPGYPSGSVWTSPYTGQYSVTLPQGSYTVSVSAAYPGYKPKQAQVTVGSSTTQNVRLDADLTACTAPGYRWNGLAENFTGWTSTTQDGWTTTGGRHGGRSTTRAGAPHRRAAAASSPSPTPATTGSCKPPSPRR